MKLYFLKLVILLVTALLNLLILNANNCMAESPSISKNQQSTLDIGEVVVTATRLEEPIKNIPASVTVITKEEIEKKRVITIDELLRDVPGLHISRFGTIGEESFPRIRGSDKRHLLVMIDGVVVNPTYDDVFDFADYHVDNIERIEIIRGSYSALYGSDAMGGVINIITKKPEAKPHFFVSTEGGSFYTFRELVRVNSGTDKFRFVLSASRTDSEGDYERDEYENNTFSANLQYNFSKDSSLNLISRHIKSKKDIAIMITAILEPAIEPHVIFDQNAATERETFINSLSYKKVVSGLWDFSLTGSYFNFHNIEKDEGEVSPNPIAFFNSDTKSTRYTLQTQHNFHIKEIDTITTGIVYEREEVDYSSNTNFTLGGLLPAHEAFKKHRTNLGFYLQNVFNWDDRWIFIAGGRIDHYDTFGSIVSPKVSSSYLVKPTRTKLKASYGRGYHAPSFDQLYSIPLGNTDLEAEKSNSVEIGFDQSVGEEFLELGATYFNIKFQDKIAKDLAAFKYINLDRARSRGVEAYIKVTPIDELAFNVNYTYTSTEDKETGEELSSIPKYMLNFNIAYDISQRFNLNMDMNFVGSEFASASNIIGLDGNPLGERNPSYKKVDLAASYILLEDWDLLKKLTLYGSVLNLLDEEYTEVIGAPSPGINFLAGLRATF